MSSSKAAAVPPAFKGVGQKPGTEIWRIENFEPVLVPQSDHGKFYSGDSYIVLQTTDTKGGAYQYDLHFWLGKDTSQDEAGTAAIVSVELDDALGGRAVQHREVQGHESEAFLSYFKPCLVPLEGGFASGFRKHVAEKFENRLYICSGTKKAVNMKQVPVSKDSLNGEDVFILDTADKIFQFNGAKSSIHERGKAFEVVQSLKEKYHDGSCDVAVVNDGDESSDFWDFFGGFGPVGEKTTAAGDAAPERTRPQLYSVTDDGEASLVEGELSRISLESYTSCLLDCGNELFVWVSGSSNVDDRKAAMQAAQKFMATHNKPKSVRLTRITQGHEPASFTSNFD